MGHDVYISTYKKSKFTKDQAIQAFVDTHSDDLEFIASGNTSPSDYKSITLKSTSKEEIISEFNKILSERYFSGYGSYSEILLPIDSIYSSKRVLNIRKKTQELNLKISEIKKDQVEKLSLKKRIKCKSCLHTQSKVRSLDTCEKCRQSLLPSASLKKIDKLNQKINLLKAKSQEIIDKAKKEEYWIVGLEFHC